MSRAHIRNFYLLLFDSCIKSFNEAQANNWHIQIRLAICPFMEALREQFCSDVFKKKKKKKLVFIGWEIELYLPLGWCPWASNDDKSTQVSSRL